MKSKYDRVYSFFCGIHPDTNILHFQWLAVYKLYSDLRRELALLRGRILDVGCGDMPYRDWLPRAQVVVGIDEVVGPKVNRVAMAGVRWPFADHEFDAVLCTQVLEHVESADFLVKECFRCLKPGGRAIFTAPFIYGEHGSPKDFFRFSAFGLRSVLSRAGFEVLLEKKQGGIGSTLGLLSLGWINEAVGRFAIMNYTRKFLFPIWILCSLVINIVGWIMDKIDPTQRFYSNVMLVVRRR